MIDGTSLALRRHLEDLERESNLEIALEAAQEQLADDLFDAYVMGNHSVIDEVDDSLTETQTVDNIIDQMRHAMTKECKKSVMYRGSDCYDAYMNIIAATCLEIAQRCDDQAKIDGYYKEFEL